MSEEITLESLKNPDNLQEKSISHEINDDNVEETHLEYKKRLNKKVSEFSDEEKKIYNNLAQKNKRKNEKNEEEIKKNEEEEKLNDEKKVNLYNQLFVLKQKFPENTGEIVISKDMNLKTLEEKKSLILKIITQKNSENVVFETLLLCARTGERGMNYFNVNALDGYAENLDESKQDIIPVLKEMIDTGEIDTTMMTPQLRLMIIMSSVAVKTIERNNDKKKNCIVVEDLDMGGRDS
tara:strand:- start:2980 stop:3690 length:711 start_codon:yes stop_codon:yes gene_type:complete